MLIDGKYTNCGEHLIGYVIVKLLCCPPETNIILSTTYQLKINIILLNIFPRLQFSFVLFILYPEVYISQTPSPTPQTPTLPSPMETTSLFSS